MSGTQKGTKVSSTPYALTLSSGSNSPVAVRKENADAAEVT